MLSIRMRDAMFGAFGARRSWRRVVGLAGLSLLAFPVLGLLFFQVSLGNLDVTISYVRTNRAAPSLDLTTEARAKRRCPAGRCSILLRANQCAICIRRY